MVERKEIDRKNTSTDDEEKKQQCKNKRRKKIETKNGEITAKQEGRKKRERESSEGRQSHSNALNNLRAGDRM